MQNRQQNIRHPFCTPTTIILIISAFKTNTSPPGTNNYKCKDTYFFLKNEKTKGLAPYENEKG